MLGLSSCHGGLVTKSGAPSLLEGATLRDRQQGKRLGEERKEILGTKARSAVKERGQSEKS